MNIFRLSLKRSVGLLIAIAVVAFSVYRVANLNVNADAELAFGCDQDCYYASDCPNNYFCNHDSPCRKGKFDGYCTAVTFDYLLPMPPSQRVNVADAMSMWFDAYIGAGLDGSGRIAATKVVGLNKRAEELLTKGKTPALDRINLAVNLAMDIAIGWDFRMDANGRAPRTLAGILPLRPQAVEMVEATKEGLRQAILQNDPNKVADPIERAWSRNPGFKPMHTGRCYAHGHAELSTDDDAKKCQIESLKRIVGGVLGVGRS